MRICAILTMNQVIYIYLLYLIEFLVTVSSNETNGCVVEKVDAKHNRQERALLFPPSSTIGVSDFSTCFFFFSNKVVKLVKIEEKN